MSDSLRVALLLDPLSLFVQDSLHLRVKWAQHAPLLARELLSRGHAVRGFGAPPGLVPRSSDGPACNLAAQSEWEGWKSKLAQFRPDVLVAYDALSPAALRAARMAKKLGAALVLVEAGVPTGGRAFERGLRRVGEVLWGPAVRRVAHAVVALDEVAKSEAVRLGFDPRLVEVVPHGVDLERYRPGLTSTLVAEHHVRGRILLYFGRLEQDRGVETLLAAFARTVGQRGDWSLAFAGEGSRKADLVAMSDRLGVSDRVHYLGRPREEELPGLFGASTLFAAPAHSGNVLSHKIACALACGLPVVASDLPRYRTLVTHEENGLLVEPRSVEAWTEAIRRAASGPVARHRWARSARERAVQQLGWPAIAERFLGIFATARERVIASSRHPISRPARSI